MSTTLKGAALALAIGLLSSPAVAGGPGSGAQSLIGTAAETTVIQQVHRCHRGWQRGGAGTHKHVGRDCRRISRGYDRPRGNRYWHRGARCNTYCVGIGPLRVCDRDCG